MQMFLQPRRRRRWVIHSHTLPLARANTRSCWVHLFMIGRRIIWAVRIINRSFCGKDPPEARCICETKDGSCPAAAECEIV